MGPVELIGLAGSVSLLAGWRLYMVVAATGLAMRFDWIALPENLAAFDALASPWVIGAAALAALVEFFADKILWLDSAWDTLHTLIRPVGGALLALAIVDAGDPVWQIVAFILGGGAALVGHGAKASTRAIVNTSPEPVSNAVVSTGEDVAAGGLLLLAFANPVAALVVAGVLAALSVWLLLIGVRLWRRMVANAN